MTTSYKWNYGYVQGIEEVKALPFLGVFYGLSEDQIPSVDFIQSLPEKRTNFAKVVEGYTFPDADNQYLIIAVPTSYTQPNLFKMGQFALSLPSTQMIFNVNGAKLPFTVYYSEYKQNGSGITIYAQ